MFGLSFCDFVLPNSSMTLAVQVVDEDVTRNTRKRTLAAVPALQEDSKFRLNLAKSLTIASTEISSWFAKTTRTMCGSWALRSLPRTRKLALFIVKALTLRSTPRWLRHLKTV